MAMKKYTEDHEWVLLEGNLAIIGITSYAAKELGDITFVEVPAIENEAIIGEVLTVVESVKAATDILSPIRGTIIKVNETLEDNPQLVNESPEEDGWICKIETDDASALDSLMTEDEYNTYIKNL
jgi:glycine cleavage system H protein